MYWLRFGLDFHEPYPRRHGADARLDPAAAGRDLRRLRPLSRPVAIRERPRPAADRARRGPGRAADSAGAGDAAAAGGRAAQRADLLPDRAHLPDGRRSLRLPDLEGASAVQPARGAGRAGARDRRGRSRRAPHPRVRAEPAMARGRARSTTIRRSRGACCTTSACWARSRASRPGRGSTACAR